MSSKSLARLLLNRNTASRSSVVRIPKFFSPEDIARVFDARDEHHKRLKGPPRLARPGWRTTYLSAGGLFRARFPDLHERLRELRHEVDLSPLLVMMNDDYHDHDYNYDNAPEEGDAKDEARSALLDGLEMRCIELHESAPGGSLADPKHFDNGSVVTADVLLDDGFEGGAFSTLDDDDGSGDPSTTTSTTSSSSGSSSDHVFELGDAIVFPSYKYHSVAPITKGYRATLVVEFWRGDENRCNHRCDLARPSQDGRRTTAEQRLCPDATILPEGCPDLVTISFAERGSFGCGFAFRDATDPDEDDPAEIRDGRPVAASVSEVRGDAQAGDHPRLVPGLVLTHVGGAAVGGLGFEEVDAVLGEAVGGEERPVEVRFARPGLMVDFTEP